MKNYHLYAFTQDGCAPCERLKEFVATLPKEQQAELDFVPLKTASGEFTALAKELSVDLTPTLVVVNEYPDCFINVENDAFVGESVTRFIGASNIIEHLPATINTYTYAIAE